MPLVQRFAQVLGVAYLLVGIVGFVPPLLTGNLPGIIGPFSGYLLGLFAVNWFHNLAHLAIGAAGLAVHRSFSASRAYALVVGTAYAALFLLGILSGGVGTLGGLLPLNGFDDALHAVTAVAALVLYFTAQMPEAERGAAQPRA